jgi:hypothetical protein
MQEIDQQVLTSTVIRELVIDTYALWLHYLGVGGSLDLDPLRDYVDGIGTLPTRERNMVSFAVNDLFLDPPWRARAPYSDADPD